jgi:hypothetical protein
MRPDGGVVAARILSARAGTVGTLDYILGVVGFLGAFFSVLWLVILWLGHDRDKLRAVLVFSLVLAVTITQPFGLVAHRHAALPANARRVGTTSVHVASVLGIPAIPFAVYSRNDLDEGDQQATASARVRSWFWLPLLTNGTFVTDMCSSTVGTPCWDPTYPPEANNLQLFDADGRYYVRLFKPASVLGPNPAPAGYLVWQLSPGIASVVGLIFWECLAVLIPGAVWSYRDRRPRTRPGIPRPGMIVGLVIAVSLALLGGGRWGHAPEIALAIVAGPVVGWSLAGLIAGRPVEPE